MISEPKNIRLWKLDEAYPDDNTAVFAINGYGVVGLIIFKEDKWYYPATNEEISIKDNDIKWIQILKYK
jgi:hypothetical protein